MSDELKHECGIAMIRLLKPLEYYQKKYGTSLYALNKMYLLMQKQVNRGQDGAGLANIKLNVEPGKRYISRYRSNKTNSVQDIFTYINKKFEEVELNSPGKLKDVQWLKENMSFSGELFLGHLRYGTYGGNSIEHCHPFLRQNNWMTRNLVLAGNFNMTNVDELYNQLIELGQHPKEKSDTVTILEKIGHFLDEENSQLYHAKKNEILDKQEMSKYIADNINVQDVLINSAKKWDGGYVMCGLIGHGDAFALRDPRNSLQIVTLLDTLEKHKIDACCHAHHICFKSWKKNYFFFLCREIEAQLKKLETSKVENKMVNPQKENVSFEDFCDMDIRVGTIIAAEKVKKTKKLLKLTVDTGIDTRTVVCGIAAYYQPEDILGKQVSVLVNLAPRIIKGIESQGMVLMAEDKDGTLQFVGPSEASSNGSIIA